MLLMLWEMEGCLEGSYAMHDTSREVKAAAKRAIVEASRIARANGITDKRLHKTYRAGLRNNDIRSPYSLDDLPFMIAVAKRLARVFGIRSGAGRQSEAGSHWSRMNPTDMAYRATYFANTRTLTDFNTGYHVKADRSSRLARQLRARARLPGKRDAEPRATGRIQ